MEVLQPEGLAAPQAPYSAVLVHGGLVFLSGQVPFDNEGRVVTDEFDTQAHQVFRNLQACLAAAGCGFRDVLKVTGYLADFDDFSAYNEIYGCYFAPPYPVRTTVQAGLYGFKLEIDAIARRPPVGGEE
jgi:2-iminobutanoate/2-iminopropanoate deaminase